MKFGWRSFKAPTPKVMKRLSRAALALGASMTATAIHAQLTSDDPKVQALLYKLTIASLILTGVGTILPFFFEDTDVQQ